MMMIRLNTMIAIKVKGKGVLICIVPLKHSGMNHTAFTLQIHHICLYLVAFTRGHHHWPMAAAIWLQFTTYSSTPWGWKQIPAILDLSLKYFWHIAIVVYNVWNWGWCVVDTVPWHSAMTQCHVVSNVWGWCVIHTVPWLIDTVPCGVLLTQWLEVSSVKHSKTHISSWSMN